MRVELRIIEFVTNEAFFKLLQLLNVKEKSEIYFND